MEEQKMLSVSHWGMFKGAGNKEETKTPLHVKTASQFVGGWPYGKCATIDEIIEKVNKQIDLKA